MKVWVCQVRREAFVGGESQRCRHTNTFHIGGIKVNGCGVMELIGGEPIEWCLTHDRIIEITGLVPGCAEWQKANPCQFETQRRVGP